MIIIGTAHNAYLFFQSGHTVTLLKLDLNYSWYHMAHAKPDSVGLVWNFDPMALWQIKTHCDNMENSKGVAIV